MQLERYSKLGKRLITSDPSFPENEELLLPSGFKDAKERDIFGVSNLAPIERSLREGQAHDALHDLRLAIQTFNYNYDFKRVNVRGQAANTRAQTFLGTLAKDKVGAADKYRHARDALLSLGASADDKSLQPLLNSELWGKNESKPAALGETQKEDPWFWTVGRPSGLLPVEEKEWSQESMLSSLLSV